MEHKKSEESVSVPVITIPCPELLDVPDTVEEYEWSIGSLVYQTRVQNSIQNMDPNLHVSVFLCHLLSCVTTAWTHGIEVRLNIWIECV